MKGFYHFESIEQASDFSVSGNVQLLLLHANKIPPHLALIVNGHLYTLSVSGPEISPASGMLRLIHSRKIGSLFIELLLPEIFSPEELMEEVRKHILNYRRVDVGVATCLTPIRDFCASVYDPSASSAQFVFELLEMLNKKNVIKKIRQFYMEEYLHNSEFFMKKYSMEDIYRSINSIPV